MMSEELCIEKRQRKRLDGMLLCCRVWSPTMETLESDVMVEERVHDLRIIEKAERITTRVRAIKKRYA